jgi:hypothetical protein
MDRCVYCNRLIPEGRMVCWICESAHVTPADCVYFNQENYICSLSGNDCCGYKCDGYDAIKEANYELLPQRKNRRQSKSR